MTEQATRGTQTSSPLQTDRGYTRIENPVVARIAGIAAQEVDGVSMGGAGSRIPGDTSPTVGEFFGSLTPGSNAQAQTRGVSVEVGEAEAAIDLAMSVEYGKPVAQISDAVRRNIINRVESLTGLSVKEVNIAVNDILLPETAG